MHLRNRILVGLAGLALASASLCCVGGGDPASQASGPPADLAISELQENLLNPPDDAKIMVRWWWFGPAVTTEELEREMHQMKDAGIGGFEVQPVYPLTLDDPSQGLVNLRYLSPEFLAAVSTAARTAHDLGLRMDMTMGSGWPYGGPHITPAIAAERLQCLRIPIPAGARTIQAPKLREGQRFLAAFVASGSARQFDAGSARRISPQGEGSFTVPESHAGSRVLLCFVAELTGQQVKRAAKGAEGNVLDHYSRAAIEKHLEAVGAPLAAAGGGNITAMFCDSLEVEGSDWTQGFLEAFQRQRGYDLTPYLPALVAGGGPRAAAVRHDWGQTLSELLNENFLAPFQAWCHAHRVLARVQAYGEPPAQLSSYHFVDLPEGEQGDEAGHWNHFTASRWASSAGHLYGVPVISAEAWTWIRSLPFRATPLDFKATADEYFLAGINQLVAHGWPYSPPGVPEPGWHFYAAGALNPHNPWWFAMPDLALYLQRASFLLRQGRPASDIAVYLPTHDAWASMSPGRIDLWEAIWRRLGPNLVPSLLDAGYNLDFVDDDTLDRGRIENGKLAIANQTFPIVVLPGIERVSPTTLARLGEFARRGGILIATRRLPSLAPGLLHQESESTAVARQVDDLFGKPSAPGQFAPTEDKSLEDELNRLYAPDVAFSPRSRDMGFVHRHTDTAEIYFIANTSNQRFEGTADFRVRGKAPEWWDLFTGEVAGAETLPSRRGGSVLRLDVEPYGSRLLVFSHRQIAPASPPAVTSPEPLDLSHGWQVTFEGTGKEISLETLRSWTEIEGLRFISGHATYQTKFAVPGSFLQDGIQAKLNFGEPKLIPRQENAHFQAWLEGPVREAAEVYVNGRRVGTVWHPPYELDVTRYLRTGENRLRIVVGNLAVNEMAGKPLPDRRALTARYGERFVDQGNELVQAVPSGLTGPVRLIARSRR